MRAAGCRYLIGSPELRDAAPDFLIVAAQSLQPFYTNHNQTRTIYRLP
jgi:hypothetical protein